MSLTRTV